MANNKIQIKRSVANATVTGLSNGELAFTQASNTLWIGLPDGTGTAAIGGVRNPGTLTANQAMVVNATSGIDKVIVANAVVSTLWANGGAGNAGDILFSNGSTIYWLPSGSVSVNVNATYTWTNVHTFNANVNANTVNATSYTVGTALIANSTGLWTPSGTVNAAVLSIGTAVISNSSGVYTTGTVNGSTISVGSTFVANTTTLNANGLTVNSTGAYVTGLVNATSIQTGTTFIANSTKVTFTGANIDATSAFLKVADAVISGNLVVSGSVVSVNTATLMVNDNIIELGDNNTTTDVVDTGWYSPAGNSSAIWYSGIARIAASSTNTNPVFKVFGSNTNPNTATTIDTSANTKTGSLIAYLLPYGTGGALVANSSNVQITANSTLGVNITANTLALSTALAGTSGGTGKTTVTNNALLVGNSTNGYNELTLGTSGYVLQSNGTAIVYDVLDGGSF
jgi:hypothetical protein